MAVTGTAALSNEIKPDYHQAYLIAAQGMLYHDQLTYARSTTSNRRGASVNFPIVESQQPATNTLSETADVVPVSMTVNEIVVTMQEYGNAIQVTRLAASTSYADVYKQAAEINGYNMAESVDYVVRSVIGQGQNVVYANNATARSGLNGITTPATRMSGAFLAKGMGFARKLTTPMYSDGSLCAVMDPWVQYDLVQDPQVVGMSQYSERSLLFNGELAYWNGVRIVVSPKTKVFWGAGGARASALATTTATNINVGDTVIYLTSVTTVNVGDILNIIDAAETGNTWTNTNEGLYVQNVGTAGSKASGATGVTVMAIDAGPGTNGGARYAHAVATTATNNSAVFPTVLLGPQSVTKAYYEAAGAYGETTVTGPFDVLGRLLNLGWWGLFGWQRTRERWMLRLETGSSQA